MKKTDELLPDEIKRKYEEALELTHQEFSRLDLELAAEVERAKSRLQKLQDEKKAVALVYEGVCARLGLNNGNGRGGSLRDQSDPFPEQYDKANGNYGEKSSPS
jgi:hypothetical protein